MTCEECGGKCCKFLVVPGRKGKGADADKYWSLRENIHFMESKRFGNIMVIENKCKNLTADGKCSDYENRPDFCKNMDVSTIHRYIVPKGCKYDVDGLYGEDYVI